MADSLFDLLATAGIRLKRLDVGHTEKVLCPRCEGGRSRELSLSCSIDADGAGATWRCHRGQCGWQNGERVKTGERRQAPVRTDPKPTQRPVPHAEQSKPEAMYAWFAKRGIGEDTVDAFGCYLTPRRFPDPIGEVDALVFPYRLRGEVVNRKYRPPQKTPQLQERNALPTLFNIDSVATPDWVWWVEGELDAMAMHHSGYPQTVSLKDGAPADLRDEGDPRRQDDKRFAALATHAELLGQVQRFILAGDMDAPGAVLREELARRLGRHRCWLVTWPDGSKDANDVLVRHGEEGVRAAVEAAVPYPIEGVQRVSTGTLEDLFNRPPPPVLRIGVGAVDEVVRFPGEGRLIVITGIPSHGKSSFTTFAMVQTALRHSRRWLVFSPEMQPWQEHAAQCAQVLVGKPFRPIAGLDCMTAADRARAEEWLAQRVTFLASDAEDSSPTLDWVLERARLSVLRDGATDLLIDPWNEVDLERCDRTETEYIGRSLQRLKSFAYRHGCNVWVVVHPTKLIPAKPGAKLAPPSLYDVAGSANWANKADLAVTIHTPESVTEVHLRKARFTRWGRRNAMAQVEFDPTTGRYRSASLVPDAESAG